MWHGRCEEYAMLLRASVASLHGQVTLEGRLRGRRGNL